MVCHTFSKSTYVSIPDLIVAMFKFGGCQPHHDGAQCDVIRVVTSAASPEKNYPLIQKVKSKISALKAAKKKKA